MGASVSSDAVRGIPEVQAFALHARRCMMCLPRLRLGKSGKGVGKGQGRAFCSTGGLMYRAGVAAVERLAHSAREAAT